MSVQHDGQTTEQIIASYNQGYASPFISFGGKLIPRHFCLSNFYAHEEVLADIISLDLLKKSFPDSRYASINVGTPEADALCSCVHQHLGLPSHYSVYWIGHASPEEEYPWHLYLRCEEPPYPVLGWDASRVIEGIWQCWRVMTNHVCHSEQVKNGVSIDE